jgi:hypothetical protein
MISTNKELFMDHISESNTDYQEGRDLHSSRMPKLFFYLLIALAVLFTGTTRLNAQAALLVLLFGEKVASENFYFSLKAGANFANLSNVEDGAIRTGFNFGLLASIKINDKFYLIPEFSPLSPKGVKKVPVRSSGNSNLDALLQNTESGDIELNYIDIPVVVKYYPYEKFNIGLGPYLSILTGANDKFETTADEVGDLTITNNIKSQFNSVDYGVVFEAGWSAWEARKGKGLNIHARYTLGLSDVVKDNPGDALKNSVFQIFVSFPFIKTEEEEKK